MCTLDSSVPWFGQRPWHHSETFSMRDRKHINRIINDMLVGVRRVPFGSVFLCALPGEILCLPNCFKSVSIIIQQQVCWNREQSKKRRRSCHSPSCLVLLTSEVHTLLLGFYRNRDCKIKNLSLKFFEKESGNLLDPVSSFTTCVMIPSPFLVISIVFVYFYVYLLVFSNVFPLGLLNAHSHFTSRQQGGIPHPRAHGAIIAPHPARVRAWLTFLWEASHLLVNVSVDVCLPSLSCEPP